MIQFCFILVCCIGERPWLQISKPQKGMKEERWESLEMDLLRRLRSEERHRWRFWDALLLV